jgi:hypothetical protein
MHLNWFTTGEMSDEFRDRDDCSVVVRDLGFGIPDELMHETLSSTIGPICDLYKVSSQLSHLPWTSLFALDHFNELPSTSTRWPNRKWSSHVLAFGKFWDELSAYLAPLFDIMIWLRSHGQGSRLSLYRWIKAMKRSSIPDAVLLDCILCFQSVWYRY